MKCKHMHKDAPDNAVCIDCAFEGMRHRDELNYLKEFYTSELKKHSPQEKTRFVGRRNSKPSRGLVSRSPEDTSKSKGCGKEACGVQTIDKYGDEDVDITECGVMCPYHKEIHSCSECQDKDRKSVSVEGLETEK